MARIAKAAIITAAITSSATSTQLVHRSSFHFSPLSFTRILHPSSLTRKDAINRPKHSHTRIIDARAQLSYRKNTIMLASSSMNDPLNHDVAKLKRLVLIGGGHAHVQVIKALNSRTRPENIHVTLIDLQSSASYSGMVPGCVAKLYTLDQVQIDLHSLASWAGTEFIQGKVVGMTLPAPHEETSNKQKLVHVEIKDANSDNCDVVTTKDVPFDVVSIDIGSTTRDFTTVPGASQYCISTRPISDLVRRIEIEEDRLIERLSTDGLSNCETKVVVVGGGAAGIELSLAMRARWGNILKSTNNGDESPIKSLLSITLLDSNDELMPGESLACRTALNNLMEKYRIGVRHNLIVSEVTSAHVRVTSRSENNNELRQNEEIPYTHCIWATGAQGMSRGHDLSWKLHEQCGISISKDRRGWILVNQYLQSISHPYIFAAGDCCEMVHRKSPPKAGVYAVRAGPILITNLMRSLTCDDGDDNTELAQYTPQDDFLKLLMCGDGTALGFRFGIPLYGKWVWNLKNHIDLMFMDLFNVNNLKKEERQKKGDYDTTQYDAATNRPPPLNPEEAAKLLVRTDDDVDFQVSWNVLRNMIAEDDYKDRVLHFVAQVTQNV
eukprot:CCRYP_004899-RB/>CCRYP_004899-RB protein AED:0.18 eAED:0.18 QI:151/0.8/0.83/1/0.8/0.83/6/2248/608